MRQHVVKIRLDTESTDGKLSITAIVGERMRPQMGKPNGPLNSPAGG